MKAAILALAVLLAGCYAASGESKTFDKFSYFGDSNSYVGVYADNETGCEYVIYRRGGITPRMGIDGKQICRKRER